MPEAVLAWTDTDVALHAVGLLANDSGVPVSTLQQFEVAQLEFKPVVQVHPKGARLGSCLET